MAAGQWVQRVVAVMVGGLVYAVFLLAIVGQSVCSRRPVIPSEWQTSLSPVAWSMGALCFFALVFTPLAMLRGEFPIRGESAVIAWSIGGFVLVVQFATIAYAWMRTELRTAPVYDTRYPFLRAPAWWPLLFTFEFSPSKLADMLTPRLSVVPTSPDLVSPASSAARVAPAPASKAHADASVDVSSSKQIEGAPPPLVTSASNASSGAPLDAQRHSATTAAIPGATVVAASIVPESTTGDAVRFAEDVRPARPEGSRKSRVVVMPPEGHYVCSCGLELGSWRNVLQVFVVIIELIQLMSLAMSDGRAAGIEVIPQDISDWIASARDGLWQGGASWGPRGASVGEIDAAFAVVATLSVLYVALCSVFIGLELQPNSWLGPILFVFLSGSLFVSLTSGLLFVIFKSSSPGQVIACTLFIVYYTMTAVFVSTYRSDVASSGAHEARVIPMFQAIERVLKGVLAALYVVFAENVIARQACIVGFCTIFFVIHLVYQPNTIHVMNVLRTGSTLIAWFTSIVMLVAALASSRSVGASLSSALVSGWIVLALCAVVFVFWSSPRTCFRVLHLDSKRLRAARSSFFAS